jgi:hypothetical protein
MLLEAETNKYCPGGYDIGAISNLITWVLNFFLSADILLKSVINQNIFYEPSYSRSKLICNVSQKE